MADIVHSSSSAGRMGESVKLRKVQVGENQGGLFKVSVTTHKPRHTGHENLWSFIVVFALQFFTSHSDNRLMTLFTPHPCSDTTLPSANVLEANSPPGLFPRSTKTPLFLLPVDCDRSV